MNDMRIFLIDNGSRYLSFLRKSLRDEKVTVVKRSRLGKINPNNFDAIILSGGHSYSIANHKEIYKDEIALIKKAHVPILGICLGFEIIAVAFGGKLVKLEKEEKGLLRVHILKKDELFSDFPKTFPVYESHHWALKTIPPSLIGLAKSEYGYEAIKHKTKPVYGIQFHPEMFVRKSMGIKVLRGFLKSIS